MNINEYNEFRWKSLAKKYKIPISKAMSEYPPTTSIPEWAKDISLSDALRRIGRRVEMKISMTEKDLKKRADLQSLLKELTEFQKIWLTDKRNISALDHIVDLEQSIFAEGGSTIDIMKAKSQAKMGEIMTMTKVTMKETQKNADAWWEGRVFEHPDTGNKVKFPSLPAEEQKRLNQEVSKKEEPKKEEPKKEEPKKEKTNRVVEVATNVQDFMEDAGHEIDESMAREFLKDPNNEFGLSKDEIDGAIEVLKERDFLVEEEKKEEPKKEEPKKEKKENEFGLTEEMNNIFTDEADVAQSHDWHFEENVTGRWKEELGMTEDEAEKKFQYATERMGIEIEYYQDPGQEGDEAEEVEDPEYLIEQINKIIPHAPAGDKEELQDFIEEINAGEGVTDMLRLMNIIDHHKPKVEEVEEVEEEKKVEETEPKKENLKTDLNDTFYAWQKLSPKEQVDIAKEVTEDTFGWDENEEVEFSSLNEGQQLKVRDILMKKEKKKGTRVTMKEAMKKRVTMKEAVQKNSAVWGECPSCGQSLGPDELDECPYCGEPDVKRFSPSHPKLEKD